MTEPMIDRRIARHVLLRTAASAAVLFLLYALLPVFERPELGSIVVFTAGASLFIAMLAVQLRAIASSPNPVLRAIEVLALAVVSLIVIFAYVYVSMSTANPAQFSEPLTRIDAIYFAATTLTTTGFGDIAAVSQGARLVVTVQMAIDLLLVAGLVRLIAEAVRLGRQRSLASD